MTFESIDIDYNADIFDIKHDSNVELPSKKEINIGLKQSLKEPLKLSPEDTVKHQSLIMKITAYAESQRFSEFLRKRCDFDLKIASLRKLNITELENLLLQIKTCIGQKSNNNFSTSICLFGISACEQVTKTVPGLKKFDISGTSVALAQNEDFLDAMEAYSLENGDMNSLSPGQRLVFIIGSAMAQQVYINQIMSVQRNLAERIAQKANENQEAKPTSESDNNTEEVEESEEKE